jgi:hypothetical protein
MFEIILSNDLVQYSFDLTDIIGDVFGYKFCYFLFEDKLTSSRFFLDNRESSLIIWFSEIYRYSPFESTLESWFEFCKFFWRTITREDNLLPCFVENIENIVEFFLGLLFPRKELDIIDDEDVDLTIFFSESIDRATFDTGYIIGKKAVRGGIDDFQVFVFFTYNIGTRLEEMSFPESDIPIEVERIIGIPWSTSDGFTCSMSELSSRSDDKIIESISIIGETTIESFDDFYSFYLLFFYGFLCFFEEILTINDETSISGIDLFINDNLY